jgi:hypothetical protein
MGESSATELQRKLMAECDRFLEERAHEYGHARKFFELRKNIGRADRGPAYRRLAVAACGRHSAQKERHPCRAGRRDAIRRRASLQSLRLAHDSERDVLPMRNLR